MDLYLRKAIHPQAHANYRVIPKLDEGEFEIGSIGIQYGGMWNWGIDRDDLAFLAARPTKRRSSN